MKYNLYIIALISFVMTGCSIFRSAQVPKTENDEVVATVEVSEPERVPEARTELRPYRRVITAEAVSDTGLFITHRVKDKLYYEIPEEELGREFLIVTRLAQAQTGTGWSGQRINNQVVRWERRNNRVLLRQVTHEITADTSRAIYRAVRAASFEPIIASFAIETVSRDTKNVIIDVTRLYTTDVPELAVRHRFRARRVDPDRSFVDRVLAFPDNIEVRAVLTMDVENVPGSAQSLRTLSAMYHHSMIRLPEEPMTPRLHDERVGYFSIRQVDFGLDAQRAEERRYITRWRLEKKDPDAELSEPVKPITFYVDAATPEQWVPWVKRGIEEWQVAFEKAGFRNAIVARVPPSPEEDPDWHPEDARYPTIRWFPSTVQNAMGPHVHDPRTGEILTSSIQMHHNVMNLLRNWYFVQASAVDERARATDFPDSLMGRLIQYVVAHEVGHTLGFPHNMKASGTVPPDSLRSPTWTHTYGTTPSIMDYARMNYIAQPGDGAYMFPKVSIYDEFAVEWGYKPIPEAVTPDAERPFLETIVRRQGDNPMLLFGHLSVIDPTQQREALSDDHIRATEYGIENIKRIMDFIIDASGSSGDDYSALRELYGVVLQQRERMLDHVVTWIGGVYGERKVHGQDGVLHTPVSAQRQRDAMAYVVQEGLATPDYLLDPEVLRRIEPTGSVDRIVRGQRQLLASLLDDSRMKRISENESLNNNPGDSYTIDEMMDDLRSGVWSELENRPVRIDVYRRNVQRNYVDIIKSKLTDDAIPVDGETRAYLRGSINEVRRAVDRAIPHAGDRATRYHLEDIKEEIRKILE
jgi:hypothetical protein